MKICYFFDISLVISRIDMKQTAKNVLRRMHSFPGTVIRVFSYVIYINEYGTVLEFLLIYKTIEYDTIRIHLLSGVC